MVGSPFIMRMPPGFTFVILIIRHRTTIFSDEKELQAMPHSSQSPQQRPEHARRPPSRPNTTYWQAPAAGFIESDWTEWLTPHVMTQLLAHGRWVDVATPVRHEVGEPFRCHFSARDRWLTRQGSQAYLGYGLYKYSGRSWWWLHSWLIDSTGTLIDSADRDEETRYFGAPWSRELLAAVNATPGHPFEDILADGLRGAAPARATIRGPTKFYRGVPAT